jgi:hypothetical protein
MAVCIFIKFDTGEFYKNVSVQVNFGQDQATIMGTLHEDLHAFLYSEVSGCRIPQPFKKDKFWQT